MTDRVDPQSTDAAKFRAMAIKFREAAISYVADLHQHNNDPLVYQRYFDGNVAFSVALTEPPPGAAVTMSPALQAKYESALRDGLRLRTLLMDAQDTIEAQAERLERAEETTAKFRADPGPIETEFI